MCRDVKAEIVCRERTARWDTGGRPVALVVSLTCLNGNRSVSLFISHLAIIVDLCRHTMAPVPEVGILGLGLGFKQKKKTCSNFKKEQEVVVKQYIFIQVGI